MPTELLHLPSGFQIGSTALLECKLDDAQAPYIGIPCEILAVHFYPGKVKYDIELLFANNKSSRVYNVDSCLVVPAT